ncbi:hypothetical protein F9L33_04940 [Amylibacter sp. SFDW26]|uniref:hypothetical protein n=1 Tax=Amylibacter sp. SFDW26 TaxID=2652722 RepID=UPI001261861D|nr:hypothetical protein [Amylibacter sp. SFDW26]KAB7616110.1 hypothetical protein F9L33_04940 [Amylibacter sp. SFDW26]
MKRRSFLSGIASAGLLPSLPVAGFAAPASAAALESVKAAEIIVRAHNSCSVPMLQRLLRVDASIASEVQNILIKRGTITFPSVAGLSNAVKPSNLDVFLPGSSARKSLDIHLKQAVKDKIKRFITKDEDLAFDRGFEPEQGDDEG